MTSRQRSSAERTLARFGDVERVRWEQLGERVRRVLPGRTFAAALPETVGTWTAGARTHWLDAALRLAATDPQAAVALYRELPDRLVPSSDAEREAVLALVAAAAGAASPADLVAVVPLGGALVTAIPADRRGRLLAEAARVAERLPAVVPRLLRVLARVADETDDAGVVRWIDRGLELGTSRAETARAYFALESRTSLQILRDRPTAVRFDEARGVTERYVHMLSGRPALARPEGGFRLRPPLEQTLDSQGMALPAQIDTLATVEDNARLYRVAGAMLAGRRELGTYDDPAVLDRVLDAPPETALLDCFLLADGFRVAHRLQARYPGVGTDLAWAGAQLLERVRNPALASGPAVVDAVLAAALALRVPVLPPWVAAPVAFLVPLLVPLAAADATVGDALRVAEELARRLAAAAELGDGTLAALVPEPVSESFYDLVYGAEPAEEGEGEAGAWTPPSDARPPEAGPEVRAEPMADDDAPLGGHAPTADELERLARDGVRTQTGTEPLGPGAYVTGLLDALVSARRLEQGPGPGAVVRAARGAGGREEAHVYLYDEWDHVIADYRTAWCRLAELDVADDGGVFYTGALDRHAGLVPEVRRHFQRVRPEEYALVRGLEDGEEIDLVAAIDAHADRRAGRAPSTKLYAARFRQRREVATLFLLDMSASTDETVAGDGGTRRIIDIAKESLVVMATALEELGDLYAIYGFSGQGRDNVEFFRVKAFEERLVPRRGRIGGIVPRGSTRMGAAVRHATTKLRRVRARARHLFLVSDGFPQDLDYGEDRRSHVYGLRDTAVALREAEAAGIRPFFLTVDLAGHDYLKEMCDPDAYCVIERVADLTRELPRIYHRVVHAA